MWMTTQLFKNKMSMSRGYKYGEHGWERHW